MSSGSKPAAAMTPATVCMPMSSMASPARARPDRPIGVRVAATMTASLASVMERPPQARTKTGIVNSSEMGWNVTRRAMPTCSSSKGQSTTLVIMRGPSARSTMAAT